MTYECDLGTGQKIYLDNPGTQTVVTIASSNVGQQQQASNGFHTGTWTDIPQIYQISHGVVIKLTTEQGEHYIQVQGNSMSVMSGNFSQEHTQRLQLQQIENSPSFSMPPMESMKPMRMGDMEMKMNPMEMRMGNMEMKMGSSSPSIKRFCSQCGAKIEPNDRFCSSCGHSLI